MASTIHRQAMSLHGSQSQQKHAFTMPEGSRRAIPSDLAIPNFVADQQAPYNLPFEKEDAQPNDMGGLASCSLTDDLKLPCSEPSSSRTVERQDEPNLRKLQPGDFLYKQVSAYQKHFTPLLEAEQHEESSRIQERLGQWPLELLVAEGYALVELSAFRYIKNGEKVHDGYTFSFVPPPGEFLGYNLFTRAQHLTVVPNPYSPLNFYHQQDVDLGFDAIPSGIVVHSSPEEIRVRFSTKDLKFPSNQLWRLDLAACDIAYLRMAAAMECLRDTPTEIEPGASQDKPRMKGTVLRERLLENWPTEGARNQDAIRPAGVGSSPLIDDPSILDWANRHSITPPVHKEGDPVVTLNASQTQAIALMFKERLSLVQGPPGTGKTRTIIEALRILKSHFKVEHPLLVCTYTNVAVDNLVEGIADAGMNPLRVGNEGGVRDGLEKWSMQAQMERHPRWPEVVKIMNEIAQIRQIRDRLRREMGSAPSDQQKESISRLGNKIHLLRESKAKLESAMRYMIFKSADVICTTCITAGSSAFRMMDFPVVFLDEASMSTEPASLIPLMHGCKHLALIGDHKQLPPVITSELAKEGGLGKSLFERLIEEGSVPSVMLDTQYRMHPSISAFPSDEFYGKALRDGTISPAGGVPATLAPPHSMHLARRKSKLTGEIPAVLFIHHDNHEISRDRSRANLEEMKIVAAVLEDLLLMNPGLRGRDIGIISPYVAQVRMLNKMLKEDSSWADAFRDALGDPRCHELQDVEIKTVDGFEGREKEIIIFSTVRNNSWGHIGFLADRRRMNVALTRAKRALFVVGSISTLSKGRHGGNFLDPEGEEMEKDVAKMVVQGSGDEWRKYIKFILAKEFFIEFNHPVDYRSPEEIQEFEKVAEAAHLSRST